MTLTETQNISFELTMLATLRAEVLECINGMFLLIVTVGLFCRRRRQGIIPLKYFLLMMRQPVSGVAYVHVHVDTCM